MFSHNKFEESDSTKLGKLFKSTFDMPMSLSESFESAVPIWKLLGLSENEYKLRYHPDAEPEQVEEIVEEIVEHIEEDTKEEIVEQIEKPLINPDELTNEESN